MASAFWKMFKPLYAVDTLEGYAENEIAYLEELGLIRSKLMKLPFEMTNWLCGMRITLYSNEPDNMVAVMDCKDGELQMLYYMLSAQAI